MKGRLLAGATIAALAPLGCSREDSGALFRKAPVEYRDEAGNRLDFGLTEVSYKSVTWFIPCSDSDPAPAGGPHNPVLRGPGPHRLPRERLVGTPVIFAGHLCDVRNDDRDVVIAVDGSGSMSWNDPRRADGGCKRLDAVNTILAGAPAGANVALFMFEEELHQESGSFFSDQAALVAKLTGGTGSLADVVCQRGGGETDFSLALRTAKAYLAQGRPHGARKELYLVSDGLSSEADFPAAEAVQIANDLKASGVAVGAERIKATIVGIELPKDNGAADGMLHQLVTSPAYQGPPSGAASIVKAVADLAVNALAGAVLDYRVAGAAAGTPLDVKPHVVGSDFTMPPTILTIDGRQTGYTLKLDDWDADGNRHSFTGNIVWND